MLGKSKEDKINAEYKKVEQKIMEAAAERERKKTQEHSDNLIKLYKDQLNTESSDFMKLILVEAIRKLESDVNPKKVENWVVNMEKSWRNI